MNISKYFWNLNGKALKETSGILRDKHNAKFIERMITFLSRCQRPKEVFFMVSKDDFMEMWPKINATWRKLGQGNDFRNWWKAVYERLIEQNTTRKVPRTSVSEFYLKIGKVIRQARISSGRSQEIIAVKTGIRQPDISKIEEGKKNITLLTLARLCKVLDIKEIKL